MSEFEFQDVAGVSFSDLFGSEEGEISMEPVGAFLNQASEFASETAKVSPNELVRVVHNNRVTWMTQQQAADFLKQSENPDVRRDVERALKGELKFVRRELEVMLAVALYTFEKCKNAKAIDKDAIERIKPGLNRRKAEIGEGIAQSSESEAIVESKRRRNPLLGEYEKMMGEFLTEKSQGNMQRAMELAQQLNEKKKYYLLLTRSIEPDIRSIYYHRLNLQKTKKRILTTQNELCSSRKDTLEFELDELKNNLSDVREHVGDAEEEGLDTAQSSIKRESLYDGNEELIQDELNLKNNELNALNKEGAIIEKQEREVDSVINTISEHVLQEADSKPNVQEAMKKEAMKMRPSKGHQSSVAKQKSTGSGMHVSRKRR